MLKAKFKTKNALDKFQNEHSRNIQVLIDNKSDNLNTVDQVEEDKFYLLQELQREVVLPDYEIIDAKEIGFDLTKQRIQEIYKKAFKEDRDIHPDKDKGPLALLTEDYFSKDSASADNEFILLAKRKDTILGFITILKYRSSEDCKKFGYNFKEAHIDWLAVDPSIQKEGVGTALMIQAMKIAQMTGKKILSANFQDYNRRGPVL